MGWNIEEVTLTLDIDLLLDWTVKDITDLERHSGMSMAEWAQQMVDGNVSTRGLRAWCWIENRKRWPNLPMSAIDEIPYGRFLDLIIKDQAQHSEEDDELAEIEDAIVAEDLEADAGPLADQQIEITS